MEFGHRLPGGEIALFCILIALGLGICYYAFHRAGKAGNIGKAIGWSTIVATAALLASYGVILLLVGAV